MGTTVNSSAVIVGNKTELLSVLFLILVESGGGNGKNASKQIVLLDNGKYWEETERDGIKGMWMKNLIGGQVREDFAVEEAFVSGIPKAKMCLFLWR